MPVYGNFELTKGTDGDLLIELSPPIDVGGWTVRFTISKRFNASSGVIVDRWASSGYGGGQSGITVTDSGVGRFTITAPTPEEFSGRDAGNYAMQFSRTDSGSRTPLSQGLILMGPNADFRGV